MKDRRIDALKFLLRSRFERALIRSEEIAELEAQIDQCGLPLVSPYRFAEFQQLYGACEFLCVLEVARALDVVPNPLPDVSMADGKSIGQAANQESLRAFYLRYWGSPLAGRIVSHLTHDYTSEQLEYERDPDVLAREAFADYLSTLLPLSFNVDTQLFFWALTQDNIGLLVTEFNVPRLLRGLARSSDGESRSELVLARIYAGLWNVATFAVRLRRLIERFGQRPERRFLFFRAHHALFDQRGPLLYAAMLALLDHLRLEIEPDALQEPAGELLSAIENAIFYLVEDSLPRKITA